MGTEVNCKVREVIFGDEHKEDYEGAIVLTTLCREDLECKEKLKVRRSGDKKGAGRLGKWDGLDIQSRDGWNKLDSQWRIHNERIQIKQWGVNQLSCWALL